MSIEQQRSNETKEISKQNGTKIHPYSPPRVNDYHSTQHEDDPWEFEDFAKNFEEKEKVKKLMSELNHLRTPDSSATEYQERIHKAMEVSFNSEDMVWILPCILRSPHLDTETKVNFFIHNSDALFWGENKAVLREELVKYPDIAQQLDSQQRWRNDNYLVQVLEDRLKNRGLEQMAKAEYEGDVDGKIKKGHKETRNKAIETTTNDLEKFIANGGKATSEYSYIQLCEFISENTTQEKSTELLSQFLNINKNTVITDPNNQKTLQEIKQKHWLE